MRLFITLMGLSGLLGLLAGLAGTQVALNLNEASQDPQPSPLAQRAQGKGKEAGKFQWKELLASREGCDY